MATKNGWWAAVLVVGMAVGCGDGNGGGGSSAAQPSAQQKAAVQPSSPAANSVTVAQDAANDAIVESGAPGATSAKTGTSASSTAGTTINYQASVTITVDLNQPNSMGQDMFPNASGQFKVEANGSVTGDSTAGQVTYNVKVTWLTDGHFHDPVCGDDATVAAGSNWSYSLVIQWSKTDDLNWSISATADVNGALTATVTHNLTTWDVTGTVTRHASLSFSRTAGNYAFQFSINGQWTLLVTNGTESHTVVVTMTALDHIMIDVDGVSFGPYTVAQIRFWWAFECKC